MRFIDPDGMQVSDPPWGWTMVSGMKHAGMSNEQVTQTCQEIGENGINLAKIAAGFSPIDAGIDLYDFGTDIGKGDYYNATLSGLSVVGLDIIKDASKIVSNAKSTEQLRETAKTGQEAHRQIQKELREQGAKTEVPITLKDGSKVRKDAVMPDGTKVIIKPNTASGKKAAGIREKKMVDNGHNTEKLYYEPNDSKYQPGSPSYIGPKKLK